MFIAETLVDEARLDIVQRNINFKELLSWLISTQHHLELFSVMAWLVWTQRNQIHLNKPSNSSHSITSLAKEYLVEFKAIQSSTPTMRTTHPMTRSQWLQPAHGVGKINCDEAVFTDEKKSSIDVVIRNSHGSVLGSLSKQLPQAYTPLEIEATAVATTLQFAMDLGFNHVVLESDSLVLVNALCNDTTLLSSNGLLIEAIRLQARFFNQLHYSYVKREGNKVTHKLARHALCISDFIVWMEDVTSLISVVILSDIDGFS